MGSVFKFNIELADSEPKIWREFLVDSDTTFYRLHHIIQIVMGWENYHLYEFESDTYRIGEQYEDDGYHGPNEVLNSQNLKIGDVLKEKGQKLFYLYDFGDNWRHLITLETVIEDIRIPFPICCFGEMNCPPEDAGSLSGFYDFLKIMENPKHAEYKHLKEWIQEKDVAFDGKYDSNKFYIERVNMLLMNIDLYIEDWEDESQQ